MATIGTNRLLTAAVTNETGTIQLDVSHTMNPALSQLVSVYIFGTIGAATAVHLQASPDNGITWLAAGIQLATDFGTVMAVQVRAHKLRGKVIGGDGSTSIDMIVL